MAALAASRASRSSGGVWARAVSRAARSTERSSRATPSKRWVYSRRAASPRFLTSARISRTTSTGAAPPRSGRGSLSRTSSPAPRRSRRVNMARSYRWLLRGRPGNMAATGVAAELSSITTALQELTRRVTGLAEREVGTDQDAVVQDLFDVERTLGE